MERILICFETLVDDRQKMLWVHLDQTIEEFEKELEQDDNVYTYERFFYHKEVHRALNKKKTWKENKVVPGDHIVYV